METLLQNLWVFAVAGTALVWLTIGRLPRPKPREDCGFNCEPMFETTCRISIAASISIFIWLAYVTVQLKVLSNG